MKKIKFLLLTLSITLLTACGGGGGGGGACSLGFGSALCGDKAVANIAPVARTGGIQNVLLGELVKLDASASSDANGDALTYQWSWVSKPEGSAAVFDSATSAAPSFTADLKGAYVAALVVNDGKLASSQVSAFISVYEKNAPPVAHAGSNQSVVTGSVVVLSGGGSTDANRDPLTYKWSLIAVPAGSAAVLSAAQTVQASFTADLPGTYVASLIANDGQLSSEAAVVSVVVTDLNAAPVAVSGPAQRVLVGDAVTLDGASSHDANRDPLTYKWALISTPNGSAAILTGAQSARPSFVADVAGVYVASLVVSDGRLSSEAVAVTVTASDLNAAPVAVPGPTQSVVTGATVVLDGVGSFDPNRDLLFYKWSLIAAPAGSSATLATPLAVKSSFVADVPGVYVASLVVSDGRLSSDAVAVTINAAAANAAPVAVPGQAQNVLKGARVLLDGSRSYDSNGDGLTYKWSLVSVPSGSAAALERPLTEKPEFTADVSGVYVLALVVNDSKLSSEPVTVTVTASAANLPPVANAGVEQLVKVGSVVMLDGSASSDANGDTLTYSWVWTSNPGGPAVVLLGNTTAKPTFTALVAGVYVATLTVSDGRGGIHSARVLVNVE